MISIGIDLGNAHTGWSVSQERAGRAPILEAFGTVRPRAPGGPVGDMAADLADEVFAAIGYRTGIGLGGAIDAQVRSVRIERPPDKVRADVTHGPQAGIGWKLGYLAGHIARRANERRLVSELVPVADWRSRMLELVATWKGILLPTPTWERAPTAAGSAPLLLQGRPMRQRADLERSLTSNGSALALVWHGCGHSTPTTFAELPQAPLSCPTCSGLPVVPALLTNPEDRAEWIRQAWKALACRATGLVWPEEYGALVVDARSRARTPKEDHELSGVADACEACWIGATGLAVSP